MPHEPAKPYLGKPVDLLSDYSQFRRIVIPRWSESRPNLPVHGPFSSSRTLAPSAALPHSPPPQQQLARLELDSLRAPACLRFQYVAEWLIGCEDQEQYSTLVHKSAIIVLSIREMGF